MQKADRNDKFGIENYGTEKWEQMCDYKDDRESRKEKLFAEASKPEQLEKLFGLIEKLVGEELNFKYTIKAEKQKIDIESLVNLADKPLICLAWREFKVENFGGGVGCNEPCRSWDIDYSKPVKSVHYWMRIHFSYKHYDGGTNGAEIGTAFFDEAAQEWILKATCEEYK